MCTKYSILGEFQLFVRTLGKTVHCSMTRRSVQLQAIKVSLFWFSDHTRGQWLQHDFKLYTVTVELHSQVCAYYKYFMSVLTLLFMSPLTRDLHPTFQTACGGSEDNLEIVEYRKTFSKCYEESNFFLLKLTCHIHGIKIKKIHCN